MITAQKQDKVFVLFYTDAKFVELGFSKIMLWVKRADFVGTKPSTLLQNWSTSCLVQKASVRLTHL